MLGAVHTLVSSYIVQCTTHHGPQLCEMVDGSSSDIHLTDPIKCYQLENIEIRVFHCMPAVETGGPVRRMNAEICDRSSWR